MTAVATTHQQEIDQWLHDNRNDVESAAIGCTHQALLFQKTKQAVLLEEIQALESRLDESNKSAAASLTKLKAMESQIGVNEEALTYLQQVTSLETAVMSAGQQVMEKALQMSKVTDGVVLEAKKELSAEVHGTWSWVSQLADLNRLHTRNAADYQTFHHSAYELNAMLNSRASSSSAAIAAIPANGMLGSIKRINTVLTDNLAQFNRLWQLSVDLMQRSRAVVPLHLRFSTDAIPFAGKNVFKFDDGETVLEPGEQVTVIDNSQSYRWTVRRSDGSEVEVPSTCIWLPPADPQAVELAIGLRRKLLNTWSQVLNQLRQWSAEFFDSYLSRMIHNPVMISSKIKDGSLAFFERLRLSSRTFLGVNDQQAERIDRSIGKVVDRITITDGPMDSLVESELVVLQTCLMKLEEHLNQWRHCSREALEAENQERSQTDLSKESSEVLARIELLSQLQKESQSQFRDLQRSISNWRLQDVASKFQVTKISRQPLFYDKSSLSVMDSVTRASGKSEERQTAEWRLIGTIQGRAEGNSAVNVTASGCHASTNQYHIGFKSAEEVTSSRAAVYRSEERPKSESKKIQVVSSGCHKEILPSKEPDTSSQDFQALVLKYVEQHKSEFFAIFATWSDFQTEIRRYVREHAWEFSDIFSWSGFSDQVRKHVLEHKEEFIALLGLNKEVNVERRITLERPPVQVSQTQCWREIKKSESAVSFEQRQQKPAISVTEAYREQADKKTELKSAGCFIEKVFVSAKVQKTTPELIIFSHGAFKERTFSTASIKVENKSNTTGSGCYSEWQLSEKSVYFKETIKQNVTSCHSETQYQDSRAKFDISSPKISASGCFKQITLEPASVTCDWRPKYDNSGCYYETSTKPVAQSSSHRRQRLLQAAVSSKSRSSRLP
ncbi:hypothetical protein BOX15_Mlig010347g1 [Macrostomum lignano]|uniref:Desmoplakin SH3 domain-containing protein n=1 Tax=Macrostomum lignano TaxID=282301 RepID=A0A267FTC3_9PLAT|nr:hypothetical protein BOX15_Mlig010347g1 [Macrostomum lignano]